MEKYLAGMYSSYGKVTAVYVIPSNYNGSWDRHHQPLIIHESGAVLQEDVCGYTHEVLTDIQNVKYLNL